MPLRLTDEPPSRCPTCSSDAPDLKNSVTIGKRRQQVPCLDSFHYPSLVDADLAKRVDAYEDLLVTLWLYTDWTYATRNMTSDQRELWSDVIDATHRRDFPDETHGVPRWWRLDSEKPNN